jgi:iron complex outermembrane receptor protein
VKKGTNSRNIGSAPAEQGSSPEHQALIENGFDLPRSVGVDTCVRYVSALPGINVPSYWTGDATIHWAATRHIELSVAGRNLFQPHHVEFSCDPGPAVGIRRSVYGQIAFNR